MRPHTAAVWSEPYLETCCRAALHRLHLSGNDGRPSGVADDACLNRLSDMSLCRRRADGRYEMTRDGALRHAMEVLKVRPGKARHSTFRTKAP